MGNYITYPYAYNQPSYYNSFNSFANYNYPSFNNFNYQDTIPNYYMNFNMANTFQPFNNYMPQLYNNFQPFNTSFESSTNIFDTYTPAIKSTPAPVNNTDEDKPNKVWPKVDIKFPPKVKEENASGDGKILKGVGTMVLVSGILCVADLVFAKGKHLKSIRNFFKNEKSSKSLRPKRPTGVPKPTVPSSPSTTQLPKNTGTPVTSTIPKPTGTVPKSTTPVANSVEKIEDDMIKVIERNESKDLAKHNSLTEAINDSRARFESNNYDKPDNYNDMLKRLVNHNYSNDQSYIQVTTRTKEIDFSSRIVDVSKNKVYHADFRSGINSTIKLPDFVGDYLIRTLPNGKKIVAISVPTGRVDKFGRQVREKLIVVSKDNQFTPMQKDLIEIISQRKNVLNRDSACSGIADILSIGVQAETSSIRGCKNIFINKEVLLSSIATAKKELTASSIDNEFIKKALNGETLSLRCSC